MEAWELTSSGNRLREKGFPEVPQQAGGRSTLQTVPSPPPPLPGCLLGLPCRLWELSSEPTSPHWVAQGWSTNLSDPGFMGRLWGKPNICKLQLYSYADTCLLLTITDNYFFNCQLKLTQPLST